MAPSGKVLSEEEHQKASAAFQKLGVCEQLAEAAAALGWKSPSSIQEQAVPMVLQGEGGEDQAKGVGRTAWMARGFLGRPGGGGRGCQRTRGAGRPLPPQALLSGCLCTHTLACGRSAMPSSVNPL